MIIILALMILGPIMGNVFCTIVDCLGDGVHINFVGGEMPSKYMVEVDFPSGKRTLDCDSTKISHPSELILGGDYCKGNGVFFEQLDNQKSNDKPPGELTVTVVVDGKSIKQTFHPEYELWYVNGEGCDPMCYYTTIEFNLSE
ncbi:MAG: hypothetical protein ACOY0R_05500 [Chloroflexota bacterium]